MHGGPQDLLILPGVWGSDVFLDGIPFFQRRAHCVDFRRRRGRENSQSRPYDSGVAQVGGKVWAFPPRGNEPPAHRHQGTARRQRRGRLAARHCERRLRPISGGDPRLVHRISSEHAPDQRPQSPPPYCVAEPNHPPPPNPLPPKKPHWGATCLAGVGARSLAYRRCRSREAVFFPGASSSSRFLAFFACRLPPGSKRAIVVSMILPLSSMRKHSEVVLVPRRLTSPESASTDSHERSRLASGEGGASAVLGATSFHTERMRSSRCPS
jgi:hypothetical protein